MGPRSYTGDHHRTHLRCTAAQRAIRPHIPKPTDDTRTDDTGTHPPHIDRVDASDSPAAVCGVVSANADSANADGADADGADADGHVAATERTGAGVESS